MTAFSPFFELDTHTLLDTGSCVRVIRFLKTAFLETFCPCLTLIITGQ